MPQDIKECHQFLGCEALFLVLSQLTGLKLHSLAPQDSDSDEEDEEASNGVLVFLAVVTVILVLLLLVLCRYYEFYGVVCEGAAWVTESCLGEFVWSP